MASIGQSNVSIEREILDALSRQILEGKVHEGQTIKVDQRDGHLEFKAT